MDFPCLIIDKSGRIIALNSEVKKIITSAAPQLNFFDLFDEQNLLILQRIFIDTRKYEIAVKDVITLKSESELKNYEITFSPLKSENNIYFIVCFSATAELKSEGETKKFIIATNEIEKLTGDKRLLSIINKIKLTYPFTFIEKAKLQKDINQLDQFFWIKEPGGKFILVNDFFSKTLGFTSAQLEGKNEQDYLPKYLVALYKTINQYIIDSSNSVVIDSHSSPITPDLKKGLQIIQFPICDLDNKTVAIIGFSQKIEKAESLDTISVEAKNIFKTLPIPILYVDHEIKISAYSNELLKLLLISDREDIIKSELTRYFEKGFYRKIDEYLQDHSLKENLVFTYTFEEKGNLNVEVNVEKIIDENESIAGAIIILSPKNELQILNESKAQLYDSLLNNIPDAMFIYDLENLKFLEVNEAALKLYGYKRNDFLNMDLTDLYAPEDIQTLLNTSDSGQDEIMFNGPWRQKKKDGSIVFVEISKSSFQFRDKNTHFNIIRDITDTIKLRKEIQLYKASYDNSTDLLFTVDNDGFISSVNKVSLDSLGYTETELDCRPFITLVPEDDRATILNRIFNEEVSTSVKLEASLKKKNGDLIQMIILATPIYDITNQIAAYSLIASPVIVAEKQKLGNASEIASGSKAETSKGIDIEFLSNVFHEILTPMNVILGFVQELVENIEKPSLEQKESMEIIEQNREVLLQTMNSLLEYSHLEQGKIEFSPKKFLFTDIVETLQKRTQKIAKTRNIEFSFGKISSSLNIETDLQKLETLLIMFITVAMHITREKKIFLSAYQFNDNHFIVSIKDSRKSISPYLSENLKNILTGVSFKKDFGVSRLTLKFSNKLCEMLSGKFKYIERNNEIIEAGFIFPLVANMTSKPELKKIELADAAEVEEITIPVNVENYVATKEEVTTKLDIQSESKHKYEPVIIEKEELIETEILNKNRITEISEEKIQESKPKEKYNLSNVQCLYVEDQVDSQVLFKVQLKEAKKIDFAVSFEAALPLLQQHKYDFIVLDINLQGEYNGLDALRIIRKLPGYEASKIIAVTAYVLPGDKDKFIAAGFNDFISKPILREKLIESLNKIMNT